LDSQIDAAEAGIAAIADRAALSKNFGATALDSDLINAREGNAGRNIMRQP